MSARCATWAWILKAIIVDLLDSKAREIAHIVDQIPGAIGVHADAAQREPQLTIRLQPQVLARWGFTPVDMLEAIQTAYEGTVVNQVYDGTQIYDLSVSLAPKARQNPALIGSLLLRSPTGVTVQLNQLADLTQTSGRYQITHAGGQRMQTVSSAVRGRATSDFVAEAQNRIATEVKLPKGTYIMFAGENQARLQSARDLLAYTLVAAGGIGILLFLVLKSMRATILVSLNLPFALVGGVLMVWTAGGSLSLGSLVGFVTLAGITLRNSIMMISHYQHLVHTEGATWGAKQRGKVRPSGSYLSS